MNIEKEWVFKQLQQYSDPELGSLHLSIANIKQLSFEAGLLKLGLVLGYPVGAIRQSLQQRLQSYLQTFSEIDQVELELSWAIQSHVMQPGLVAHPQIKNIIAIGSGKGGVGKSTTTVNLALALAEQGARVGILDADIYGPNQPRMLGAVGKPELTDDKKLIPLMCHGLQTISMGYLVDDESPMIWRGPMVSSALQQLLRDTRWDNLDYLFIDLPPGTGDIQLTLSKKVPVTGAVIVTTPQDVALLDAQKGLAMFNKVNVKVLGIVENMTTHTCSQCGHEEAIFGEGGADELSQQFTVPLLGRLPLAKSIREDAGRGQPTVVADPKGVLATRYRQVAFQLAARLALQKKNYASKFPEIVVEAGG